MFLIFWSRNWAKRSSKNLIFSAATEASGHIMTTSEISSHFLTFGHPHPIIHSLGKSYHGLKYFYRSGDHWCRIFAHLILPGMVYIVKIFQGIDHFHSKSICQICILLSLFLHTRSILLRYYVLKLAPYLCKWPLHASKTLLRHFTYSSHETYSCKRWPGIHAICYRRIVNYHESNLYSRIRSNGVSDNRGILNP